MSEFKRGDLVEFRGIGVVQSAEKEYPDGPIFLQLTMDCYMPGDNIRRKGKRWYTSLPVSAVSKLEP